MQLRLRERGVTTMGISMDSMNWAKGKDKIIWAGVLFMLLCSGGFLLPMLTPDIASEKHRRDLCATNLGVIGSAMLEYRNEHGRFLASTFSDPVSGLQHSWRVALLPYLGDREVYEGYRLDEAWNSPTNVRLTRVMPGNRVYSCPSRAAAGSNETSYVMLTDSDANTPSGATNPVRERFVLLIEVERSGIHWAEPRDIAADDVSVGVNDDEGTCISSPHPDGAHILWSDGQVEFLSNSTPSDEVRRLLVRGASSIEQIDPRVPGDRNVYD